MELEDRFLLPQCLLGEGMGQKSSLPGVGLVVRPKDIWRVQSQLENRSGATAPSPKLRARFHSPCTSVAV